MDGRLVLRRRWVSLEGSLQFANECKVSSGIGNNYSVLKPLPFTHGDGGGIQSGVLIDKAFWIHNCVRLARMSHHSHRLLKKILGDVPEDQRDNLSEIGGGGGGTLEPTKRKHE